MAARKYDFAGYATRNNLMCSDGRTIRRDAFKDDDKKIVPLVWNHQHNGPENVIGHALLENRPDGVYAYCSLNDTERGEASKSIVQHGDVVSLSIWANRLKEVGKDVIHGTIREVSLVLAGANPGALIDAVLEHGDGSLDEAFIYMDQPILMHSDSDDEEDETEVVEDEEVSNDEENKDEDSSEKDLEEENEEVNNEMKHSAEDGGKTIQEVFDTLNEEQKDAVYAMIGMALEEGEVEPEEGGNEDMKHNVFDVEEKENGRVLSHSEMTEILNDAKKYGSLRESFLAHAGEYDIEIETQPDLDFLFPDNRTVANTPDWIKRDTGWVQKFMNSVHHTPFSRIKSMHADITADEARAKGYTKGNRKLDEVITLLRRKTDPTTVYKKQKLDRDDVVDITSFDVVAWLKAEMRMMLDEEIARASLVGDGRSSAAEDKINEINIRPIYTDDDLYSIKVEVPNGEKKAKEFIKAAIRARKDYKGSGMPTLYTTEDMLTEMLLLTDDIGRDLYDSVEKLATKLRVKEIVTVEVMEGLTREVEGAERELAGIIVNPVDYNIGADKGGAVNMFDDFDIDYNAQKYLIETRCSGALIKPYSALVLEFGAASGGNDEGQDNGGEG